MADGPVILFDAECILCSANARFILRHDKAARFRLASVQRVAGAAICRHNGVDPDDPTTLLLVEDGRVRRDSDAILGIYQGLGFPWALAGVLRLIPAALRDRVYRWIARNRYRFFGKRQSCWIAPPETPVDLPPEAQ